MNEITSSFKSQISTLNEIATEVDPVLYKFSMIILGLQTLPLLCNENRVFTWLKNLDTFIEKDTSQARSFVCTVLRLDSTFTQKKIEKRQNIALIYANILAQYIPEENGNVSPYFNYLELATVVDQVFLHHSQKNTFLFSTGIQVLVGDKLFCAKIQGSQVCIFSSICQHIGEGGHGIVRAIYDISIRQLFALKISKSTELDISAMLKEISNLEMMHGLSRSLGNLSVEGLQLYPYMTLMMPNHVGYLGKLYGPGLDQWIKGSHENAARIDMCKSLMRAFKNKTALGLWHGDLKEENVLTDVDGCVIIDWGGSLFFQEAWRNLRPPEFFARHHTNWKDYKMCENIFDEIRKSGMSCKLQYDQFMELAHARELFTVAMLIFKLLTSISPFEMCVRDEWPCVEKGIRPAALEALKERKYSDEIVKTITKMLEDDYKVRYSVQEAIDVWEKMELGCIVSL